MFLEHIMIIFKYLYLRNLKVSYTLFANYVSTRRKIMSV